MADNVDPVLLIGLVKKQPSIWNRASEGYKNRDRTTSAWYEICKLLWPEFNRLEDKEKKHLVQLGKRKWNNIRDHWQKSMRKDRESNNGSKRPRKYQFHNLLTFLENVYSEAESVCSIDDLSVDIEEPELVYDEFADVSSGCAQDVSPKFTKVEPKTPTEPTECQDERHLMFFKGIIPSLRSFNEDQTVDFQLGVLQMIRNIKRSQTSTYSSPLPKIQTTTSRSDQATNDKSPMDNCSDSQCSESNF